MEILKLIKNILNYLVGQISYIAFVVLILLSELCYGQDTTYYVNYFKKANSKEGSNYYEVVFKKGDFNNYDSLITLRYNLKNKKIWEKVCSFDSLGISICITYSYFNNGKLMSHDYLRDEQNNFNHFYYSFFKNGKFKRQDTFDYEMNSVGGKCFSSNGSDTIYYPLEIMPKFSSGTADIDNFISKNIKYPYSAREFGIQGKVIIKFTINKDGSISDPYVWNKNSVNERLQIEALRMINIMPKWKPALYDGSPIEILYTLPIIFSLK